MEETEKEISKVKKEIESKEKQCESNKLDIQAFDYWSTDTKQDAWFTASSFEAVFESMEQRPK